MDISRIVRSSPVFAGTLAIVLSFCSSSAAQPVGQGPEFSIKAADGYTFLTQQRTRSVASTASGSFLVVWTEGSQSPGIHAQLYASDGIPSGTQFVVSGLDEYGYPEFGALYPAVDHSPNGGFVVVWYGQPIDNQDPYGGGTNVLGRRVSDEGMPTGTEFVVSTTTPAYFEDQEPDVAANIDGSFVVVWQDAAYYPASPSIRVQRMNMDGSPNGTEFAANTATQYYVGHPQVDTAAEGDFVVVWTSGVGASSYAPAQDGAYAGVFGQRFGSNGAKLGTEFQVNTFTTYSQDKPDVAVASGGSFVVVWRTQYGDEIPNPNFPGQGPPILLDDSVTMRRYNASGDPLGDEVHINTFVPGSQIDPTIAMNTNGSFVVAWESTDGYYSANVDNRDPGAGVIARCFNADGTGAVTEFQINTYGTGDDRNLSLATDGSGNFVATWERVEDEFAFSPDLFGRRFSVTDCPADATTTTTTTLPPGGGVLAFDKDDNGHGWGNDATIPYEISLEASDGDVADIVLTETVPEMTTFNASASTPGWSCSPDGSAGSTCTYNVGTLMEGEDEVVMFAADVNEGTPAHWDVYNEVSVSGLGAGSLRPSIFAPLLLLSDAVTASVDDVACMNDPIACVIECIWCWLVYTNTGDPTICDGFDFAALTGSTLEAVKAAQQTAAPGPARLTTGSVTSALYSLRDRVLNQSRGGQRAIDLYYEHSPAIVAAAMSDMSIATQALATVAAFEQNIRDLAAGAGDTAPITQGQIDTLNTFLDTLRAQATGDLADAIDRERARLDLDGLVDGDMDDAFEELGRLTCEGFETTLFCGEVTGDCSITATDALRVLRIAVGSSDPLPEADLDGNGSTTATDALFTLNIAVGLAEANSDCNVL